MSSPEHAGVASIATMQEYHCCNMPTAYSKMPPCTIVRFYSKAKKPHPTLSPTGNIHQSSFLHLTSYILHLTLASTSSDASMSPALRICIHSPVAISMPLFIALYTPLSFSLTHRTPYTVHCTPSYSRMTSTDSSVLPPSTITCSTTNSFPFLGKVGKGLLARHAFQRLSKTKSIIVVYGYNT